MAKTYKIQVTHGLVFRQGLGVEIHTVPVWEIVSKDCRRMAVPGGWLYITVYKVDGHLVESGTFVPRP